MGVGGADNPFWLDVLEWGPDSAYAGWFDIDWDSDRGYLHDKLLVPILGDHYGAELVAGNLDLRFDAEDGSFAVWAYGTHKLPICPLHYGQILGDDDVTLERVGDGFSGLPSWRPQVLRRAESLKTDLADLVRQSPELGTAVEAALARLHGRAGEAGSWSKLDALIQQQFWRPRSSASRPTTSTTAASSTSTTSPACGWNCRPSSTTPTGWCRASSATARSMAYGSTISTGLLDPKGYLERLRARAPARPGQEPFYLVVEKILAPHEPLRADWPVDGTTGYEVTNQLLDLLIDPGRRDRPIAHLRRLHRGNRAFRQDPASQQEADHGQ